VINDTSLISTQSLPFFSIPILFVVVVYINDLNRRTMAIQGAYDKVNESTNRRTNIFKTFDDTRS